MMRYDGQMQSGALSVVALATGGTALLQADQIAARRREMIAVREQTFAHLRQRGIHYLPSDANMFMVDWRRPATEMKAAFAAEKIDIGRSWAIWPTRSRITVGSADDMRSFCASVDRITA